MRSAALILSWHVHSRFFIFELFLVSQWLLSVIVNVDGGSLNFGLIN